MGPSRPAAQEDLPTTLGEGGAQGVVPQTLHRCPGAAADHANLLTADPGLAWAVSGLVAAAVGSLSCLT